MGRKDTAMKTYYCVTTTFDDKGRVTAAKTGITESDKKPENTYSSTRRKDIYNDWFDCIEAASRWIEEAKKS